VSVWDALTTRQIARILTTVAALSAFFYLLVQIRSTLMLFGIAVFLAVALGPAVDLFSRGKLPRGGAILLVYLLIFALFTGVLSLIVPPVVNGATDLSRTSPATSTTCATTGRCAPSTTSTRSRRSSRRRPRSFPTSSATRRGRCRASPPAS